MIQAAIEASMHEVACKLLIQEYMLMENRVFFFPSLSSTLNLYVHWDVVMNVMQVPFVNGILHRDSNKEDDELNHAIALSLMVTELITYP